jgi:hypothetical protein
MSGSGNTDAAVPLVNPVNLDIIDGYRNGILLRPNLRVLAYNNLKNETGSRFNEDLIESNVDEITERPIISMDEARRLLIKTRTAISIAIVDQIISMKKQFSNVFPSAYPKTIIVADSITDATMWLSLLQSQEGMCPMSPFDDPDDGPRPLKFAVCSYESTAAEKLRIEKGFSASGDIDVLIVYGTWGRGAGGSFVYLAILLRMFTKEQVHLS